MNIRPHFRLSILAAREALADGRDKLRQQHERGTPSPQVCARMAEVLDSIVLSLFNAALDDLQLESLRGEVALIPHGGYGRRDVSPYSDLDLMVLYQGSRFDEVAKLVKRLMQDLYDVNLAPGHSVRTPGEAVAMARSDAKIFSSLVESRFLTGSEPLYRTFDDKFRDMTRRRYRKLHEAVEAARRQERSQFGETVYLLRPNVKRSRGALREIQLLRWIGFARFGTSDLDGLAGLGALSKEDRRVLRTATEFLLRIRNDMHFHAGQANDVLDRAEQVRLAEKLGYQGSDALLPVEQFMREYFRHTTGVRNLVSRFVTSVRPKATMALMFGPLFSHQIEGDFRVGPSQISATRQGLQKLKGDLAEVLRLCDLANHCDKRIDHATWEAVCRAAPNYADEISPDVAARFLSLLSQPAQLGDLLRRLLELGVLEKLIPALTHARYLLQFNDYHKYTVDEHSIRAVENAADFIADPGPLGEVYRSIKQRRVLHLALLVHDLGKGYTEDHSEVGRRIAEETCRHLKLPEHETEMVKRLVHKHLVMAHLAFRRNTSDPQAIVNFAVEVGSPELLKMLYVLTCADLAAVGPGVLNSWKVEVLTSLYHRTLDHLAGEHLADGPAAGAWLENKRNAVRRQLGATCDDFAEPHVALLPASYLMRQTPAQIAAMFVRLRQLKPRQAAAWGVYQPESKTLEFTVVVDQGHGRGVFSRLTGALTSLGLEILSADINSLAGETILDCFLVQDPDFSGPPPKSRIEGVCKDLIRALDTDEPPRFAPRWKQERDDSAVALAPRPTEVRMDNSSSSTHTILDVFALDRRGLLYTIARTLFELKLSIGAAKIGTYLDQVVDVFYITDQQTGAKIADESRQQEIRARLLEAIESLRD